MTADEPWTWLTTDELAERFDVPARIIRRMKYRGKIQPVGWVNGVGRGGKVDQYDPDDVAHILEAWKVKVASKSGES